jgi:ferredoxin
MGHLHDSGNGGGAARFTITLANEGGQCFEVDGSEPLLNTLEDHGVSLPYGCRYGGCISCAAKLLRGDVDQSEGVALNGRQLADGYVLLCVARPRSDCTLEVGVESHDKLYRNPFQSPLRPDELKAEISKRLETLEGSP